MKVKAGLVPVVAAGFLVAGFLAAGANAAFAAPGDIVFERPGSAAGVAVAVFPHWTHRARFRCYVCHTEIFEMKKGANKVSMEKIMQGESCGKCHNGTIAFKVEFQTCQRCHKPQVP